MSITPEKIRNHKMAQRVFTVLNLIFFAGSILATVMGAPEIWRLAFILAWLVTGVTQLRFAILFLEEVTTELMRREHWRTAAEAKR